MISALLLLAAAPADDLPECNEEAAEMGVQQEMNICAHRDYLIADAEMNAQWRITSEFMKERDREIDFMAVTDEPYESFQALLDAQRAWIAFRDAHCRSEGYEARGGSLEPLLVATCKRDLTEKRTAQLRSLAETY